MANEPLGNIPDSTDEAPRTSQPQSDDPSGKAPLKSVGVYDRPERSGPPMNLIIIALVIIMTIASLLIFRII